MGTCAPSGYRDSAVALQPGHRAALRGPAVQLARQTPARSGGDHRSCQPAHRVRRRSSRSGLSALLLFADGRRRFTQQRPFSTGCRVYSCCSRRGRQGLCPLQSRDRACTHPCRRLSGGQRLFAGRSLDLDSTGTPFYCDDALPVAGLAFLRRTVY